MQQTFTQTHTRTQSKKHVPTKQTCYKERRPPPPLEHTTYKNLAVQYPKETTQKGTLLSGYDLSCRKVDTLKRG